MVLLILTKPSSYPHIPEEQRGRRRRYLICFSLLFLCMSLCLSVVLPCLSLKAIHTTHLGFGHPLIWFGDINVKALRILPNPRAKPSFLFPNGWIQAPHLLNPPTHQSFASSFSHSLSLSLSFPSVSLSLSYSLSPLPFGGGYIRYNQFNFMQPGQTPWRHKYTHFLIHSTPGKAHPPQAAPGPLALNY